MFNSENENRKFLYSMRNEQLMVYSGTLHRISFSNCIFRTEGRKRRSLHCSAEPYEVYNGMVWMPEKDDSRARDIFIRYHRACIDNLTDKIRSHVQKIEILEEK